MGSADGPLLTCPLFTGQQFTPTEFSSAIDKTWFANALCRFIADDFSAQPVDAATLSPTVQLLLSHRTL